MLSKRGCGVVEEQGASLDAVSRAYQEWLEASRRLDGALQAWLEARRETEVAAARYRSLAHHAPQAPAEVQPHRLETAA
jgi:hypothetical protein